MTAILLPVAVVLVGGSLALAVWVLVGPRTAADRRIQAVEDYGYGSSGRRPATPVASAESLAKQLVGVGDKIMEGRESVPKTMQLLERADLRWRVGEWFILRVVSAIAAVAGGMLFLAEESRVLGVAVGLVVGFFGPPLVLRFLAKRRANKFEKILPDVLMLVATSLTSGFSLPQALDAVAKDSPEPAAKEFSRALAETRIGTEIADALDSMALRMDSENMRWATMAIRIQREVGGNLAETLRTSTKTLRERQQLKGQIKALSAEGRLSAYVLIGLPFGLFFYMLKVNYEYIQLLWTTMYGWIMIGLGVLSLLIGIFWMRKTVNIEV